MLDFVVIGFSAPSWRGRERAEGCARQCAFYWPGIAIGNTAPEANHLLPGFNAQFERLLIDLTGIR